MVMAATTTAAFHGSRIEKEGQKQESGGGGKLGRYSDSCIRKRASNASSYRKSCCGSSNRGSKRFWLRYIDIYSERSKFLTTERNYRNNLNNFWKNRKMFVFWKKCAKFIVLLNRVGIRICKCGFSVTIFGLVARQVDRKSWQVSVTFLAVIHLLYFELYEIIYF